MSFVALGMKWEEIALVEVYVIMKRAHVNASLDILESGVNIR